MLKSQKHAIPLFLVPIFMIFGHFPVCYAPLIGWGGALASLTLALFLILREGKTDS